MHRIPAASAQRTVIPVLASHGSHVGITWGSFWGSRGVTEIPVLASRGGTWGPRGGPRGGHRDPRVGVKVAESS
eukprot:2718884-Prymnesium_polylepis.1